MATTVDGRCYCSAIRFRLELPVDFCSTCHCESCRRSHGAPMVTWTSVPLERFCLLAGTWDRELGEYHSSPEVAWYHCRNCGSPLFYKCASTPERIYLALAALDGSHEIRPDSHVSAEERVEWHKWGDGLPCYRGKTDQELESLEITSTVPQLQAYLRRVSRQRGWDNANDLETFLLFTEEVGELAKAIRNSRKLFAEPGKGPVGGIADELADVFSYVLDLANRLGVDLDQAFRDKERVNSNRTWT